MEKVDNTFVIAPEDLDFVEPVPAKKKPIFILLITLLTIGVMAAIILLPNIRYFGELFGLVEPSVPATPIVIRTTATPVSLPRK